MIRREDIETALLEAESHIEAATAERDRLLRHYGAELGLSSARAIKAAWEESKAVKAGTREPDPATEAELAAFEVKIAANVKLIDEMASRDAVQALAESMIPAVRKHPTIQENLTRKLNCFAVKV